MAESFQGVRSLIESSPEAVSLIDPRGEILFRSASTTKISGYLPHELVGQNWLDLIHPEDRGASNALLLEVLAVPSGRFQWEARLRHKSGRHIWVENTIANLLSESNIQAIVIYQGDITLRRAAEQERQDHAVELARCNSRVEEFAYTAAHDLREPLRTISVYTEMLMRETQMDSKRMMAAFVVDGATRMSALIDDLMSFASTGKHEPRRCVGLQHVLWQSTQNLALSIKASGATITADRLPDVLGNEIQLVRLMQNLLSNAVKYRSESPLQIHVSSERRELDWIITIEDNGIGIAAPDHARVFMPFVRLGSRDVPGTGLGLAVCKKIVEGLGGTMWIDSEIGAGSRFSFTIEAAKRMLSQAAASTSSSQYGAGSVGKILQQERASLHHCSEAICGKTLCQQQL